MPEHWCAVLVDSSLAYHGGVRWHTVFTSPTQPNMAWRWLGQSLRLSRQCYIRHLFREHVWNFLTHGCHQAIFPLHPKSDHRKSLMHWLWGEPDQAPSALKDRLMSLYLKGWGITNLFLAVTTRLRGKCNSIPIWSFKTLLLAFQPSKAAEWESLDHFEKMLKPQPPFSWQGKTNHVGELDICAWPSPSSAHIYHDYPPLASLSHSPNKCVTELAIRPLWHNHKLIHMQELVN